MRFIASILCLILLSSAADAKTHHHSKRRAISHRSTSTSTLANPVTTYDNSTNNPRYAALVMDGDTGNILYEKNSHEHRYPASLTKMMTLYMTFEQLKQGKLRMDSHITASKKAASQPQTNIALRPGDQITVEQAVKAVVVRSANDVAVALAEQIGGSEWNFGVMMTNKARQLGMNDTVFRNANGLPDTRQYTSAYDMAVLGRALRRDFPQYYPYFSIREAEYQGRRYPGHNRVLDRLEGVDGIKTGFINASGFNLVSSLKQNGVSLVAVVMGGYTGASRDNEMVQLLKKHYTQLALLHQQNPRAYAQVSSPVPQTPKLLASAAVQSVAPAGVVPSIIAPVAAAGLSSAAPANNRAADDEEDGSQQIASIKPIGSGAFSPPVASSVAPPLPTVPAVMDKHEEAKQVAIIEPRVTAKPQFSVKMAESQPSIPSKAVVAVSPVKEMAKVGEPTPAAPKQLAAASLPKQVTPAASPAPASPFVQASFSNPGKASASAGKSPGTLDYQFAMLSTPATNSTMSDGPGMPLAASNDNAKEWGIQVGAFRSQQQAKDAVSTAMSSVAELKSAYMNITNEGDSSSAIHRARLGNLTKNDAEAACKKLNAMNSACFPLRIN